MEKAFEQAFSKALEQTLQNKAEALFKKAFTEGLPFSRKLEEKIEQGFQHFWLNLVKSDKCCCGYKELSS